MKPALDMRKVRDPMFHHEQAALKKLGLPQDGTYRWCKSAWHDSIPGAFQITVAIYLGLKTSGKYKGCPKYDSKSRVTTIVVPSEIKASQEAYEAATGNCHECQGTRFDHSYTAETKFCRVCKGTGTSSTKRLVVIPPPVPGPPTTPSKRLGPDLQGKTYRELGLTLLAEITGDPKTSATIDALESVVRLLLIGSLDGKISCHNHGVYSLANNSEVVGVVANLNLTQTPSAVAVIGELRRRIDRHLRHYLEDV